MINKKDLINILFTSGILKGDGKYKEKLTMAEPCSIDDIVFNTFYFDRIAQENNEVKELTWTINEICKIYNEIPSSLVYFLKETKDNLMNSYSKLHKYLYIAVIETFQENSYTGYIKFLSEIMKNRWVMNSGYLVGSISSFYSIVGEKNIKDLSSELLVSLSNKNLEFAFKEIDKKFDFGFMSKDDNNFYEKIDKGAFNDLPSVYTQNIKILKYIIISTPWAIVISKLLKKPDVNDLILGMF